MYRICFPVKFVDRSLIHFHKVRFPCSPSKRKKIHTGLVISHLRLLHHSFKIRWDHPYFTEKWAVFYFQHFFRVCVYVFFFVFQSSHVRSFFRPEMTIFLSVEKNTATSFNQFCSKMWNNRTFFLWKEKIRYFRF